VSDDSYLDGRKQANGLCPWRRRRLKKQYSEAVTLLSDGDHIRSKHVVEVTFIKE
jgi:hypothetical protein